MDLNEIRDLLQIVAQSDVAEVEVESGDMKIIVRRNAPTVMMQAAPVMQQPSYVPYPGAPSYGVPSYPPSMQGMMQPGMMPPSMMQQPAAPPPPIPPAPVASPPPAPAAAPEEPAAADDVPEGDLLRAPIVGTYYSAASPDSDPFVSVGERVTKGQTLCIIEAMKIMNEIEAESDGVVKAMLAENAQAVEYDQPLFVIASA